MMHVPTTVELSPQDNAIIADQLASGRFGNVSEVVHAGLRLLEREQARLQALREAIAAGDADIAAGRIADYAPGAVAARMKSRRATAA
jgi:antitoxin ParD1/3/4